MEAEEKEFSAYILTDMCEIHIIELLKLEKIVKCTDLAKEEIEELRNDE